MNKTPIKIQPGDEMHLTILMATYNLNLVVGQDRQRLLSYGRAAFDAGQATAGVRCHDADACAMGQSPCPTPAACGCAPVGRSDAEALP